MRCKNHYTDPSSIVGVCASCLRERLFYLLTTQSQTLTLDVQHPCRNLDSHPVFPRSVSPYITRRKSDISASSTTNLCNTRTDQRFFSTPQLQPTHNNNNNNNQEKKNNNKKQYSFGRFNLLSKLFRSRKQKESESDSDPRFSVSNSRDSYQTSTSAMSSPFRLKNIRSSSKTKNKNKNPVYYSESSTGNVNRKQYCPDRGMSPVRLSNCVEDEFHDLSSGYETCESRKQTPWRTPAHSAAARLGGGGGGGGGGLMFCLSPLVRASPCRKWNQKGGLPADGGDNRGPVKAHLSNTKSFCANRSRKLADIGRFNSNR